MKTIKILGLLFAISFITLVSCNKDEVHKPQYINVSDYERMGEIHNSFLTNAHLNFYEDKTLKTKAEKIDHVRDFQVDFISTLNLTSEERKIFTKEIDNTKGYVVTEDFAKICYSKNNSSSSKSLDNLNVFELLDYAQNNGILSDVSYSYFYNLSNDVKLNYLGQLSDNALKANVANAIVQFNSAQYPISNGEAELVATVLSITKFSIDWWEENPDAPSEFKVAPWVAADAIGAVLGAVSGMVGSYATTGDINWGATAISAGANAINSSLGIVGKIASWFT